MGNEKKPNSFTLHIPDKEESVRDMPDQLETVEYRPDKRAKDKLPAGAYDPYSRDVTDTSDTARMRRPRVDLRKLSEWIKTTQSVKALREEDLARDKKPGDKD
jgi:hypothetical protein